MLDADLRFYTTELAVDDLDDIREWLGFERINIYGTSYGTRVAQVYMRKYGEHVRSVILKGVNAMNAPMPLYYARDAERALNLLLDDCAADEVCAQAFPNLRGEFKSILAKFEKGCVAVAAQNLVTGRSETVYLSRGVFAETLRNLLYSPVTASQVPLAIHKAAAGDFSTFVQTTLEQTHNQRITHDSLVGEDAVEHPRREAQHPTFWLRIKTGIQNFLIVEPRGVLGSPELATPGPENEHRERARRHHASKRLATRRFGVRVGLATGTKSQGRVLLYELEHLRRMIDKRDPQRILDIVPTIRSAAAKIFQHLFARILHPNHVLVVMTRDPGTRT